MGAVVKMRILSFEVPFLIKDLGVTFVDLGILKSLDDFKSPIAKYIEDPLKM